MSQLKRVLWYQFMQNIRSTMRWYNEMKTESVITKKGGKEKGVERLLCSLF